MSVGSMSSLYIGVSGLRTNQNALNTTAHNIANADTQGYTRQQVLMTDATYLKVGFNDTVDFKVGTGTTISAVRQVRDKYTDLVYRQETSRENYYKYQYETATDISSYFGEVGATSEFQNCLQDFWSSLNSLQQDPSDLVARKQVVQNANTLVSRANNIYNKTLDYQKSLNEEITKQVNSINSLADEILKYNYEISKVEATGVEHANDLRDKRNSALDELSGLIDISYEEDVYGNVIVKAEGVTLVNEYRTFEMSTTKMEDTDGFLKPIWKDYEDADVFDLNKIPNVADLDDRGSLKGILIARGNKAGNYTDIPKKSDYEDIEAYNKAVEVYERDVKSYTITNAQAQFDQLINNIITSMNDILSPNVDKTLTSDLTLSDGTVISAGTTIKVLDTQNAPKGMDTEEAQGMELFSRDEVERYQEVVIDGETYYMYNEENKNDKASLYTLGNVTVNSEVMKNPNKLPLSSANSVNEYDNEVVSNLLNKWSEKDSQLGPSDLTDVTFDGYYTAMIGDLANVSEIYGKIADSQQVLTDTLESKRQQTSGVSTDEELTNIVKFQQAYNACSRYISVVSEMMESLINLMGR